jgi:hypothetical protein
MTYKPEYLERWTHPESFGIMESGWQYSSAAFIFLGRNRDSDILTESNFDCALRELGGESDTVKIVREGHWACGWIEWIAIHESDSAALETADSIVATLSDYPVLCDEDFSEREWNAAQEYWESLSVSERMGLCKDNGVSIFAARRDYIPSDDSGGIYQDCLPY